MAKKFLSKRDILGAEDMRFEDVDVPEWGGAVRVKSMNGAEKDAFEVSILNIQQVGNKVTQKPDLLNMRAKMLARCVVDENGALLFAEEDVLDLGRKSAGALDRVMAVAKRLNRMDDSDLAALTESLKNAPPADSHTD